MFQSASGSVALKKNTWGIPWNIQPGTQNLYLIKLNWQYYRRLNAILYIQLLKYYVTVIIHVDITQSFHHGPVTPVSKYE